MKKCLQFLLSVILFISCQTAKKTVFNQMVNTENTYFYTINLINVEKDKVYVPSFLQSQIWKKGVLSFLNWCLGIFKRTTFKSY